MPLVNTVMGPISADNLGLTLMHEHLVVGLPGWECDALGSYDREAVCKTRVEALQEAKGFGVKSMVDPVPADLGRDVELAKMISDRTGLNIILATGLYNEASGASPYFKLRSMMLDTVTEISEIFIKEVTQGIGKTGVKAGVIKVATGHGAITPYEETVLKAAAKAQKETGVPIMTHTEAGTMGPEQADLLISEGADPTRIVIGHMCGNANLQYHVSVLEKGVYIGFDRLGVEPLMPDNLRKACIIGLAGIGYANRIILSQDHTRFLGRPWPWDSSDSADTSMSMWSYTHVFRNIIPALKKARVSDETIKTMMVDNPRRIFAGE